MRSEGRKQSGVITWVAILVMVPSIEVTQGKNRVFEDKMLKILSNF